MDRDDAAVSEAIGRLYPLVAGARDASLLVQKQAEITRLMADLAARDAQVRKLQVRLAEQDARQGAQQADLADRLICAHRCWLGEADAGQRNEEDEASHGHDDDPPMFGRSWHAVARLNVGFATGVTKILMSALGQKQTSG